MRTDFYWINKVNKRIYLLIFLTGSIFLVLVLFGSQKFTRQDFQEGKYRRPGMTLFFKEGHFTFDAPEGYTAEEGSYTVDGDTIVFLIERHGWTAYETCGDVDIAIYKWSFDAKTQTLTLNDINDSCAPRAGHLVVPYKYVPGEE